MKIENLTVTDSLNQTSKDFVLLINDDGSYTSMLKADYDEQQANSTLPSNSSIPQAGA